MDEQNLGQDLGDEPGTKKPNSMALKKLQKIQNNRYLNQNIYQMFILGRYKECMNLIQKCKPDQFKLYMKSLIYKNQFQLQKSLSLLNQCEIMNKLNFNYLKGIAKNYYLLGKYKSSLQAAKQAYKLNNSDYQIFYIMAKISFAMKDIEGAIASLHKSIAKQPNQQSFLFLSKIMMDKGNYRQASQQLKRALSISPENYQLYEMLGQVQEKLGHKKQSVEYYNKSLQINPNGYDTLFSLAAIHQANMQIDEALQKYANAYKITQNSPVFWNNLSAIMLKKNKEISAYCCLKKALFLDPFRYDIHVNLGLLLLKIKKFIGAQIHFQSALKLKKDIKIYNLLAQALFQLGDLANAQKCYEQIFKKSKENKYKINYLCVMAKKGEIQKCKKLIEQLQSSKLQKQEEYKLQQIKAVL